MNHPNVAKVFDAGATEPATGGRPYFVMEYVPGVAITDYCDRHRLSTPERLKLFMQVCEAVQHAHQKGIIHRDIKPSNVLVTVEGDKPVPKVIDFGVAKATEQRLTEKTFFTEQGQLIGTPEYMSPEQAEMTALDIDTRTDIYSLGVLLYELLTSALPFERKSLRRHAMAEIQRIIREVEPPKPSTRLSELASGPLPPGSDSSSVAEIAKHRRTDPSMLTKMIRGDLDWVTMKAIEKDRTRRYATASEFADDLARHLNHEPVLASPPSATYRLSKFVRRNRTGVAAVAVIAVVLLVATGVSIAFALSEAEQRRRAEVEAKKAETVAAFTQEMLSSVDPKVAGDLDKRLMKMILENAAARVEKDLQDQPEIEAQIRSTIGNTYRAIGEYPPAEPHLERALEIRKRVLGEEHPSTLGSMNNLVSLYWAQGRYDQAEPLYLQTLEVSKRVLGEEHPATLISMHNLANLYSAQGRYDQAEPLLLQALEARKRVLGEEHPDTLYSLVSLAALYRSQGRYDQAKTLYLQALEVRKRVLGEEHPDTLNSMNNLVNVYKDQGRNDQAEPLYLQVLEGYRRVLGEEHPYTLNSMNNLALLYRNQGRYDEAEPLFVKTLELQRRVLGEEHPATLGSMGGLADLYRDQGRYDEAEPLFVKALELRRRVLGEEHPATQQTRRNLLKLFKATGKLDEARPYTSELLTVRKRAAERPGADARALNDYAWMLLTCEPADLRDPEAAILVAKKAVEKTGGKNPAILDTLALAQKMTGDLDQAIETEKRALDLLPPQRSGLRDALEANLVKWLKEKGDPAAVEQLYRDTLTKRRAKLPEGHPDIGVSLILLGMTLVENGNHSEAELFLRECLDLRRKALPEGHWLIDNTQSVLGASLAGQDRFADAEPLLLDGYSKMKNVPERWRDVRKREALERIVKLYESWGKAEKAAEWRAKLPQEEDSQP